MKFGDTLHRRSVPEWSINNIDYNDLKHLIKVYTSNDQSRPRTVPSGNNVSTALLRFEQELYTELQRQHDRISDFVHVKAGELSRRLVALDKEVERLEYDNVSHRGAGLSRRRAEKFSRLDLDIHKAGEDIQSLSRFAKANTLAFYKLFKKYRKWTGSRALEDRFCRDVLNHAASFSRRSLEALFAQYIDVLEALRFHYATASTHNPADTTGGRLSSRPRDDHPSQPISSAARLQVASQTGSIIDLDTALAITPLGSRAVRAVYWVHPDNVMNAQILLMRHTSPHKFYEHASPRVSPTSSRSSPRGSASGVESWNHGRRKSDEIGLIICDEPRKFAQRRSSKTVEDIETLPGIASEEAIASIRFARAIDPVIAIDAVVDSRLSRRSQRLGFYTAKLNRKDVRRLFDTSNPAISLDLKDNLSTTAVAQRLAAHRDIRPLVKVQSRRSRFLGLENSPKGGVWATLDTEIHFRQCSPEQVAADKYFLGIDEDAAKDLNRFPHAILEVRVEGIDSADLIKLLDESHLAERVRGFSLETHAVAVVCKPLGMPPPFWMPALGQDIRKVPPLDTLPNGRAPKNKSSLEQPSTGQNSLSTSSYRHGQSSSGFSALPGESSATSAPDFLAVPPVSSSKNKRRRRRRSKRQRDSQRRSQMDFEPRQPCQQRYWNEYDEASEGERDDVYAILVDPEKPSAFPGIAVASKLYHITVARAKALADKIASWRRSSNSKATDPERDSLTNGLQFSPDDSDPSGDDMPAAVEGVRQYSTFPTQPRYCNDQIREGFFFRSCVLSFAASLILLIIAAVLLTIRRKKVDTEVDISVVIGVTASLIFAILGVSSMMASRADLGWVYRAVVVLTSLCVLLIGVALLAATSRPMR